MASDDSYVLVIGQVARDLVLAIDRLPEAGASADVHERRELLGGKGANQAVGLRQLGNRVALLGVVGEDDAGSAVLDQARADGIDVSAVTRRGATALLVDLVDADGTRRLFEHVPAPSLVTPDDLSRASGLITGADTVCIQLQQPPEAALAAAQRARAGSARIVLDGAVTAHRDELLALADVLRMDVAEAALTTDDAVEDVDDARRIADDLLRRGPSLVAVATGDGDLVAWADGDVFLPHGEVDEVDPTGAGDAFVAGLVTGLRRGLGPADAARLAHRAAGATVGRLGGRPDLAGIVAEGLDAAGRA
jgi:ribokinase